VNVLVMASAIVISLLAILILWLAGSF
jgi:hypothetical protein